MKRNLIISLLLLCLSLTACNSTSIGIIGGADGPTAMFVGENKETLKGQFGKQLEKRPIRMFNVDGELYYDSGLISENVPRCGTMDGALEKTVKENEIPLKSGEANFEAGGYQNATSITKEAIVDGKWVIFKKYDTYSRALDGLKYCYHIKGRLNGGVVDSEMIVLSEDEDVTFDDVYAPLLSSVKLGDRKGRVEQNFLNADKWGLILYADDITPNGMTLKIEQFGAKPSGELQTGAAYYLETMIDDEWQEVKTITGEPLVWNSLAYMIKKNDITQMNIDWRYAYGQLKPGYYRLKKEFMDFRSAGDYDIETYEMDFVIE
ncbi:MAG: sodium ion-translocating decarboxylase subunit beta [Ruminococcaceae bacterium]|nr:sodium ion-translocating decarboxylase subunit beta [Oscillospiraceae bacterium]